MKIHFAKYLLSWSIAFARICQLSILHFKIFFLLAFIVLFLLFLLVGFFERSAEIQNSFPKFFRKYLTRKYKDLTSIPILIFYIWNFKQYKKQFKTSGSLKWSKMRFQQINRTIMNDFRWCLCLSYREVIFIWYAEWRAVWQPGNGFGW